MRARHGQHLPEIVGHPGGRLDRDGKSSVEDQWVVSQHEHVARLIERAHVLLRGGNDPFGRGRHPHLDGGVQRPGVLGCVGIEALVGGPIERVGAQIDIHLVADGQVLDLASIGHDDLVEQLVELPLHDLTVKVLRRQFSRHFLKRRADQLDAHQFRHATSLGPIDLALELAQLGQVHPALEGLEQVPRHGGELASRTCVVGHVNGLLVHGLTFCQSGGMRIQPC